MYSHFILVHVFVMIMRDSVALLSTPCEVTSPGRDDQFSAFQVTDINSSTASRSSGGSRLELKVGLRPILFRAHYLSCALAVLLALSYFMFCSNAQGLSTILVHKLHFSTAVVNETCSFLAVITTKNFAS